MTNSTINGGCYMKPVPPPPNLLHATLLSTGKDGGAAAAAATELAVKGPNRGL